MVVTRDSILAGAVAAAKPRRFEFPGVNGTVLRFVVSDGGAVTVSVLAGRHVRGCTKYPPGIVSDMYIRMLTSDAVGQL